MRIREHGIVKRCNPSAENAIDELQHSESSSVAMQLPEGMSQSLIALSKDDDASQLPWGDTATDMNFAVAFKCPYAVA